MSSRSKETRRRVGIGDVSVCLLNFSLCVSYLNRKKKKSSKTTSADNSAAATTSSSSSQQQQQQSSSSSSHSHKKTEAELKFEEIQRQRVSALEGLNPSLKALLIVTNILSLSLSTHTYTSNCR